MPIRAAEAPRAWDKPIARRLPPILVCSQPLDITQNAEIKISKYFHGPRIRAKRRDRVAMTAMGCAGLAVVLFIFYSILLGSGVSDLSTLAAQLPRF